MNHTFFVRLKGERCSFKKSFEEKARRIENSSKKINDKTQNQQLGWCFLPGNIPICLHVHIQDINAIYTTNLDFFHRHTERSISSTHMWPNCLSRLKKRETISALLTRKLLYSCLRILPIRRISDLFQNAHFPSNKTLVWKWKRMGGYEHLVWKWHW